MDQQAQAAQQAGGLQETLIGLAPILFFIALIYLLIIRPQNSRRKKHQEMINNLKKGDKIIFKEYSTTNIELDDTEYLIVKEDDVLATLK